MICGALVQLHVLFSKTFFLHVCERAPTLEETARFLFPRQLKIEVQEQCQEILVGIDWSLLHQFLDGPLQGHVVVDYEVREHQGR